MLLVCPQHGICVLPWGPCQSFPLVLRDLWTSTLKQERVPWSIRKNIGGTKCVWQLFGLCWWRIFIPQFYVLKNVFFHQNRAFERINERNVIFSTRIHRYVLWPSPAYLGQTVGSVQNGQTALGASVSTTEAFGSSAGTFAHHTTRWFICCSTLYRIQCPECFCNTALPWTMSNTMLQCSGVIGAVHF